ncbi:GNAT family N-acetyltransferase [Ammoniphilus sp. CFH 90114]|uniref:GNAT family N-acetyltransferase n=1 Tax=Ammoniphilus sp. CFH 90114 TaxID=2493665 RepID=UPI00100DA415|nr:GNAT family protein [Ammoniphilus sp. CFH 90114]RXT03876.1 N-acetyltransferase [Ammoniphilus sp. CFH 90114]
MEISGNGIDLRPLQMKDVSSLLELRSRNRKFLEPYEPKQRESHFTVDVQTEVIEQAMRNWEQDLGYSFGIFLKENGCLIGRVNLSNVVRGAWRSCTIGYFLDEDYNGKGIMTEAVGLVVDFAFSKVDLHRVQAGVMPQNLPSIRVLEKVGFRYEGLAKYYLNINGNWEDHNIYSITKEFWS